MAALGKHLCISESAVYKRFNGRAAWTLSDYLSTCRLLGIPVDPSAQPTLAHDPELRPAVTAELDALSAVLTAGTGERTSDTLRVSAVWASGMPCWAATQPALLAVYEYVCAHWVCGGFDAGFDLAEATASAREASTRTRERLAELGRKTRFDMVTGATPLAELNRAVVAMARLSIIDGNALVAIQAAGRRAIAGWMDLQAQGGKTRGFSVSCASLTPASRVVIVEDDRRVDTFASLPGMGLQRITDSVLAEALRSQTADVLDRACTIGRGGVYNHFQYRQLLAQTWEGACAEARGMLRG